MKFLAKIIIIITIFTFGFYFGIEYSEKVDLSDKQEINSEKEKNQVSLMLDFGNGRIETFNDIEIGNITNVFEFLVKVTTENDMDLKYKEHDNLGVFIEAIDGVANDFKANYFWQYWVDNNYALAGASNLKLKGGEIVEWKYLKGQF